MRCYYQIGDGEWIKGYLYSERGLRDLRFQRVDEHGAAYDDALLMNPEFNFCDTGFRVTGFRRVDDRLFKIESIDVRWTKPRPK